MSSRTIALIVPLFLFSPLAAQATNLERDIDFVRALATRMRFVSLAQSEVDRMKQRYKDATDFQSVAQLGVEISLIGAKIDPNREQRRTLYQEAISRSSQFLERYPDGPASLSARITLSEAALEFGKFLADEIEVARVEAPGRVNDLEEQAKEVFRTGTDTCDKIMSDLEGAKQNDARAKQDHDLSWMRKGVLLREQARAVQDDRGYLTSRSRDTLENLIFDVGEETLLGQRALLEYAQNDEVEGLLEQAVMSYTDVIDNSQMILEDEDLDLSSDARQLIGLIFQEAFDRLGSTLFELGKIDDVLKTVDDFRERMNSFEVKLTDLAAPAANEGEEDQRFGHSLYLTYGRALAESGVNENIGKALTLVQYLSEAHPYDFVGQRAKIALKEILAAQSERVSGELLFQVAKGDFQSKDWERAIRSTKAAIAAMDTEELGRLGLEAYYMIGQAQAIQERVLEATYALKEGLEKYAATADNATKDKASSLIQRTMRQVRSNAKGDKFFQGLDDQVARVAEKFVTLADASKRAYSDGNRLMGDKDYDGAIRAFGRIRKDSLYHELAMSAIVTANQRKGDFDTARAAIATYRTFLETPEAKIPDKRNDLKQARDIAKARTDFYEGYMVYQEGLGQGGTKDLTKFPEAVTLLNDFDAKHGTAEPGLVPRVHYVVGRSHIEMGHLDKAEEKYRTLKGTWPRDANVPVLASSLFAAHNDQVTALQNEVDALAKKEDKADLDKARKALETARRKTISIGKDYVSGSDSPQYGICYLVLQHLEGVKDWSELESFGNSVIEALGKNEKDQAEVDKYIRPIIGDAVLRQRKFRQAYDMLSAASAANPKDYPLKRLICLALGGWQEINELGQVQRYLGLGKPAEAYDIYWTDYKTYGLNKTRGVEPYSIDWYQFHWEVYHFALAASEQDSQFRARAKTIYSKAQSTDNFQHLTTLGLRGRELFDLFSENTPPR